MERNLTEGSKGYRGCLKSSEYYEGEKCLGKSYSEKILWVIRGDKMDMIEKCAYCGLKKKNKSPNHKITNISKPKNSPHCM